jgi:hypothetical protein
MSLPPCRDYYALGELAELVNVATGVITYDAKLLADLHRELTAAVNAEFADEMIKVWECGESIHFIRASMALARAGQTHAAVLLLTAGKARGK